MRAFIHFFKAYMDDCNDKHLITLASSATFFFSLCILPLTLLSLSFFDEFVQLDTKPVISFIEKIKLFLPDEIYTNLTNFISFSGKVLTKNNEVGSIHYVILLLSSLSFFGSIWKAVDIIAEAKPSKKLVRRLKSFITIAVSFALILILSFVPFLLQLIHYVLDSEVAKYLKLDRLLGIVENEFTYYTLSYSLLLLFFAIIFKFLLRTPIEKKFALVGSFFFGISLYLSRFIFYIYISYTKSSLIFQFGSFYSVIVFIFWVFSLILMFFAAITLTLCLQRNWDKIMQPSSSSILASENK